MQELTKKVVEFTRERDWDQFHSPENLAKSISIEAGELLECFQWNNEYNLDEVKEELADVINYCILMADKLGVDSKRKKLHESILLIKQKEKVQNTTSYRRYLWI